MGEVDARLSCELLEEESPVCLVRTKGPDDSGSCGPVKVVVIDEEEARDRGSWFWGRVGVVVAVAVAAGRALERTSSGVGRVGLCLAHNGWW